jgi:hypothetical protein
MVMDTLTKALPSAKTKHLRLNWDYVWLEGEY